MLAEVLKSTSEMCKDTDYPKGIAFGYILVRLAKAAAKGDNMCAFNAGSVSMKILNEDRHELYTIANCWAKKHGLKFSNKITENGKEVWTFEW